MFIIPCKFTTGCKIYECVDSIKKHFPYEKIVVVDSCSEFKEYCQNIDVDDVLYGNTGYEIGAYIKAFEKYPDEKYYQCFQDSVVFNKWFDINSINIIRYFLFSRCGGLIRPCEYLNTFNINSDPGIGVFGNNFSVDNYCMRYLYDFFKILPKDKKDSENTERLLGYVFVNKFGYDLKKISIQGEHIDPLFNNDETFVTKYFMQRL